MRLKEFLVSAKAGLADLQRYAKVHVVIGNESCDLDSAISAITYAYFLDKTKPRPDTLYLPVLNILQGHFRLRLEIVYFLGKHDIVADDLVFLDDLDLTALARSEAVTLSTTLVDHHELTKTEEVLRDSVVEVLDHRPQNGVLPDSWNAHIERVGSCCTIISRKLLESEGFSLDSTLAELLLGTILMDTGNMSASDGVGMPADRDVLAELKEYLPPDSAEGVYEGIKAAKSDLSSLKVIEMLYKDLKVLPGTHITVAMASISMKLEEVLSRPEFLRDCREFCSELPADVILILTLWRNADELLQRRIAVFSLNRIYREQITDVLLNSTSPNLELQRMTSCGDMEDVSAFIQNNVQVFRKGVIPLIREFLAGETSSPDENLNATANLLQHYSDLHLGSGSTSDKGDTSEEEARRHINLAKTFQSDQFRTSQDRYDLAAVGTDPVISPSLSSDSELSSAEKKREVGEDPQNSEGGDIGEANQVVNKDEFRGEVAGVKGYGAAVGDENAAGDWDNIEISVESNAAAVVGGGAFVEDLVDFEFGNNDVAIPAVDSSPQSNIYSDFEDLLSGGDNDLLFVNNAVDAPKDSGLLENNAVLLSDLDVRRSKDERLVDHLNVSTDITVQSATGDAKEGDELEDYSPFSLLCPDHADSLVDFSSIPTSNQTSGQVSKVPSYPDTPPNSCIEPSSVVLNKETQLPSFNSSEMVKRIQDKKAALVGLSGTQKKSEGFDDEDNVEGLFVGGEYSSGGGNSLISPAVPQNSYMDVVGGFSFQSSPSQLPKLMNSDIMERVNEKRSHFEWSVESLEGSTSGVDVGPNSEERVQKAPFGPDGVQTIPINTGVDPQTPYTPQNSYVEENFNAFARSSLPSLNNAEIVAKIKAKQSAMFGSGSSSRVSRSSHGSDDSGGCRSPDVVDKNSRGQSLDSPQGPYTPQNSYRDNLGALEPCNHLPDLNEVAERLSTENALKHQFGKRSISNSGGGSRDEENINLHINQQGHRRYGRNSSSQSDSQNTMSDVESLMSVSTDIATPSENIVAAVIASQMRNEVTLFSRKDTNDSDVFPANKIEDGASDGTGSTQPKVSHIDLGSSEKMATFNLPGAKDKTGGDDSDDVVRNGYAGAKELFSPFDSDKVRSIEDHAIFEAAEYIVAQSVAAAVEASQRDVEAGKGRKEVRLRWSDDVVSPVNDDVVSPVNDDVVSPVNDDVVSPVNDDVVSSVNNDDSDIEEDQQKDDDEDEISKSLSDNDLDRLGRHNGSWSNPEEAAQSDISSVLDSIPQQQSHLLNGREELDNHSQITSQNNHDPPKEFSLTSEAVPGVEAETANVSLAEQSIADLALNELAFELANELIQSVLDDFPFSHDFTNSGDTQAEDGVKEVEQERSDVRKSGTLFAQNIGLDETRGLEKIDLATRNVSRNNDTSAFSVEVPPVGDENDFGISAARHEEISSSNTDLAVERDFESPKKQPDSSLESNPSSSSLERKRSRDSSMTILENEMVTSFPERKTSAEFIPVEEEDVIQSFPGRKFSKSEDFPSRRFSRDESTSRRSSKLEDMDLEVSIGPEDIETDYLPSMDPLQGNLDIIDTSFSKITDVDCEVVEGQSFRKVNGVDVLSGGERDDDDEEEGSDESIVRLEEDDYMNESGRSSENEGSRIESVDNLALDGSSGITDRNLAEDVRGELVEQDQYPPQEIGIQEVVSDDTNTDNSVVLGQAVADNSFVIGQAVGDGSGIDSPAIEVPGDFERREESVISQVQIHIADASDEDSEQDVTDSDGVVVEHAEVYREDKVSHPTNVSIVTEMYDTDSEGELQATEDPRELEDLPTDISNEPEFWATRYSREFEKVVAERSKELDNKAADSSHDPEIWATEDSGELEEEPEETSRVVEIEALHSSALHSSSQLRSALHHDGGGQEDEEGSLEGEVVIPKQKKKIRVSFSEDFDEEIGDFNITSSSRSPLKSPPPLPSSGDSDSSSSSPVPGNFNSAGRDEDESPSSVQPSQWVPPHQLQRKEVYHTSAGRISIALGEEDGSGNSALDGGISPQMASPTDHITVQERAQVDIIIGSAKGAVCEADEQLEISNAAPDSSLSSSEVAILDSSNFSQTELLSHDMRWAHDNGGLTFQHESNSAFNSNFATFDPMATFDSFTSLDSSDVNSNPKNDSSVRSAADSPNQDRHSEGYSTEPDDVTSHPPTSSQQQTVPATLTLSELEPLTFDPFTSIPTHVRNLSSASAGSVQGAVYSEEWQDDEIIEAAAHSELEDSPDSHLRKKILPEPSFPEEVVVDNDIEAEENETKQEEDEDSDVGDLEWERRRLLLPGDDTPVKTPDRPGIEPTLTGESTSQVPPRWKRVSLSGSDYEIDMQAVEPYKNVLSHGGYYDEGLSAIIVFYGCNLPNHRCEDYTYIMNHLFLYVIHTLEELVADDYVIIYFHGSTPRKQMPSLSWLKRCYQSIDRRLKKNLKGLFLVHPTIWLRTVVMMTKPFISSKFSSKLRFVRTLEELNALVPLNSVSIPEIIVHFDIHHKHLPTPPASPHHIPSS